MGCCLSRSKSDKNDGEEVKKKISDFYYDEKYKSNIECSDSEVATKNNDHQDGNMSVINNEVLKVPIINFVNKNEDPIPVSSKPKPRQSLLMSLMKSKSSNNLNDGNSKNSNPQSANSIIQADSASVYTLAEKKVQYAQASLKSDKKSEKSSIYSFKDKKLKRLSSQIIRSNIFLFDHYKDNIVDIKLKLINFEFTCENFMEIFRVPFNPSLEIYFEKNKKTFNNIVKKEILQQDMNGTLDNSDNVNISYSNLNRSNLNEPNLNRSNLNESNLNPNNLNGSNLIKISQGLVELIDSNLNSSFKMQTTKLNHPFIEFVFSNDNLGGINEFTVQKIFKTEIFSWITFSLYNKSRDVNLLKDPLILAEGYLPINYLMIQGETFPDNIIKIPIRNISESLIVGYLNLTIINNNSQFLSISTLDFDIAHDRINNFYVSNNIQMLNDVDPVMIDKNFPDFELNENGINNLSHLNFTGVNNKLNKEIIACLEEGNIPKLERIIYSEKNEKIYQMRLLNQNSYYCFLTICNQIFGYNNSIYSLNKSEVLFDHELILEKLKKLKIKFFNTTFFQLDLDENTKTNYLLLNNFITILITLKKEKYIQNFSDQSLKEAYSLTNIFNTFGSVFNNLISKISKINEGQNFIQTNFILYKNIQNKFLFLVNLILEDYLTLGIMNDGVKQNSFSNFKSFFLKEIETMKYYFKNSFLSNAKLLITDQNYILNVLKMLINYLKFLKIYSYANKYSHVDVYINDYTVNDNCLNFWLLNMLNNYISNPRFFPLFLEFVNEFIQELNGIHFFNFKKYFEIHLFTMNFVPYQNQINTNNILIWFYISNIFLKFSKFCRPDNFQLFDYLSLTNKEVHILMASMFNMLVILFKCDYFKIDLLRFSFFFDDTLNCYVLHPNNFKRKKFLLSSFHIKILINILNTINNLLNNPTQFANYVTHNLQNFLMLEKHLIIIILLKYEKDQILFKFFSKNKILFFKLFENILNFLKLISEKQKIIYLFMTHLNHLLKETYVNKEIILPDRNVLWENIKENLKLKLEFCISNLNDDNIFNTKNKKLNIIKKLENDFHILDEYNFDKMKNF